MEAKEAQFYRIMITLWTDEKYIEGIEKEIDLQRATHIRFNNPHSLSMHEKGKLVTMGKVAVKGQGNGKRDVKLFGSIA